MDFLGTTFLLAGSVLLVAALEQTGIDQSWNSPVTVTFLVSSGVFWLLLLVWERYRGQIKTEQRSVFPWRLVQNRLFMGLLL